MSGLNLYELSKTLENPWLWVAFYVYGTLCSFIIDFILKHWPLCKSSFILYGCFGFIPFVIYMFPNVGFILIAGVIGTVAALLFWIGLTVVTKNKILSFTFSVVLPFVLLFVSTQDFTKKADWEAERKETSFEAEFTYFNGEHKIPIELKEGDSLLFGVTFIPINGGGWGNHLENEKGKYMPMMEVGEKLRFEPEENGTYFIVIEGNKARGNFLVEWDLSQRQ